MPEALLNQGLHVASRSDERAIQSCAETRFVSFIGIVADDTSYIRTDRILRYDVVSYLR